MLDAMLDHLHGLHDGPVWRAMSPEACAAFAEPLPRAASALSEVHATFQRHILPHGSGNIHPGFMGWVQGGGTAVGMLAEMLAAGLNANCGGRTHAGVEIERQVAEWTRDLFDFPVGSTGVFTPGASAANFMGLLLARTRALGAAARTQGLSGLERPLTAYASVAVHGCVRRGMEMAGLGGDNLRLIPVDADHRIRIDLLCATLARDRQDGRTPFALIGTAGTVDCGAVDDLDALADVAAAHDLHFHVDGALGALGALTPVLRPRLRGIARADSLALDWHKWGQVPYSAGFFLARDPVLHRSAFAADAAYLARAERGLAAGDFWPCDYGPELSRGFQALKVWFTLKTYGADALGAVIAETVRLAQRLAQRIAAEPELEILAPHPLNIVCFRYRAPDADRLNAEIVQDLHEAGRVAPSLTTIGGATAIRAAIVNHRTRETDVEALVEGVLALGRRRMQEIAA